MKKEIARILGLVLCVVVYATSVEAGSLSSALQISATIGTGCQSIVTTPIDFADVDSTGGLGNGSVTVTCSSGVSYQIALDGGLHPGATRALHNSGSFIPYNLYYDAGLTQLWGDQETTGFGTRVGATGSGSAQTFTVYGAIPLPEPPTVFPAGTYTDTVMATVHF